MLDTVPAVPAVADAEVALSVAVEADKKRLPPSEATVLRLPLLTTTVLPLTS